MRIRTWSAALIALALAGSSCSENGPVSPVLHVPSHLSALAADAGATVVISQVYGGGGNTGSTFRNDFIELHNRGSVAVSLTGWSVQYTSAAGAFSTGNTTALGGSIGPGQYVLVQEAAQGGGTVSLPTPEFTGAIAMSATNGKVALLRNTVPLPCSGSLTTCTSDMLVDFVGYGTANGFEGTAAAPGLVAATAALRRDSGCQDTNDNAADFVSGTPTPRNTASAPVTCEIVLPGDIDHITVSPAAATITQGGTQAFTAAAFDAANQPVAGTFAWSLDPATSAVASIDPATGVATGLQVGDVGIVATSSGKTGNATLHVVPAAALTETRFSEIHYDNLDVDVGEAIEIEGPAGTSLTGWDIVLYNGNGGLAYNTVHLSGTIPATCGTRGVVVTTYLSNGIQNGGPDGFALVQGSTVVEFLSYEGSFVAADGPAAGMTSSDVEVAESSSSPIGQSLQRRPSGPWNTSSGETFGACNTEAGGGGGSTKSITFSGRLASDPALPVGFEDQLFATLHDGAATPTTTFTWTSATPDIASIDANGVMHALAPGTATFIATAADGTTGSFSLPTIVAALGGTADYRGNAEFGIPTDADAADDFIITRDQYTISYNHNRNTPNWVSYEFDQTHFEQLGQNVDRCDCFTHDPALPGSFTHLSTADYTGAGAFAGFGIDRGHMARSFDFTSGALDNARSYYFSNIIPQAADMNQGPWAILENELGNRARTGNKEVYVVAGVAGNRGTIKNEGKIVMPASVWKVALVLPRDQGLASVRDYRDIEDVIAVIMPNDPGVRNVNWETYRTTIDEVERVSGYDLLALLPDRTEDAIESNTTPPLAAADGPYASTEGAVLSLSSSQTFVASGRTAGFVWSFGDGTTATGPSVSHTYAQDGLYTVSLTVTDNSGLSDTFATTAAVTNVAPNVSTFAGATLLPGETYNATGSFTDPGADPWSATVNYGDGPAVETVLLSGKTFTLAHTYMSNGLFTVTVRVSDDDVTTPRTQSVTVITPTQALGQASGMVTNLAAAANLNSGNANSLSTKIDAAQQSIARGNAVSAANQLQALLRELDAMVRSGRVTSAEAQALRTMVERVISSISLSNLSGTSLERL